MPIKQRVARTTLQVLVAMRWLIDKIGWTQHNSIQLDEFGKPIAFCIFGANCNVQTDTPATSHLAWISLKEFAAKHGGIQDRSIINWNDTKGRTKKQVVALLDKAIAQEKKRKRK